MCQIETVRAQSSRPQLSQPERCSQHWDPPNKPSRRPPRAIRQALELKQRPREKSPAFGRLWRRLLGAVETPLLQGLTPPAPCPSPALTVTSPGHTTSGLPYPQPEPHTAARERSKTAVDPAALLLQNVRLFERNPSSLEWLKGHRHLAPRSRPLVPPHSFSHAHGPRATFNVQFSIIFTPSRTLLKIFSTRPSLGLPYLLLP